MMQESAPLYYQLQAGTSEQYSADADDAESSVGDSHTRLGWMGLALCPSQLQADSDRHQSDCNHAQMQLDADGMGAKQAGGDHSSTAMSMTDCGDDFELFAEDADQLLHDATAFDAYPGGVEAALADWEAAVSSKAAPVAPIAAAGAEASSSSCCNYAPQPQLPRIRLPPWRQQQLAAQWQQQQQQFQQQQFQQQQYMAQLQPAPYSLLAAHKQQQLQQWLQQLPTPPVQQPFAPGPWLAAAAAAAAAITLDPCQQQKVVQPAMQQSCPFAAFKGDVVGAVLAGLVPAPSCDSNDEWMGPMCPGLPC